MNAKAIGLSKIKVAATSAYYGTNEVTATGKFQDSATVRGCVKAAASKNATVTALTSNGQTYFKTANGTKVTNSATVRGSVAALACMATQVYKVTGKDATSVVGPNVSDYQQAQGTITMVQNAINNVSSQRSALGALQNRLEHTIANLDNVAENTQSAESRIRDTDMAEEMVTYSKNNILAQAGQSMLAQANQSSQGVLSLLQ